MADRAAGGAAVVVATTAATARTLPTATLGLVLVLVVVRPPAARMFTDTLMVMVRVSRVGMFLLMSTAITRTFEPGADA